MANPYKDFFSSQYGLAEIIKLWFDLLKHFKSLNPITMA